MRMSEVGYELFHIKWELMRGESATCTQTQMQSALLNDDFIGVGCGKLF